MSPRDPVAAFIALGANLGDPLPAIARAVEHINALPLTTVTLRSGAYRSAPVGASGPDYVNAVIGVLTRLCAPDMLLKLQKIEQMAGRTQPVRNAPRTLDLDILLFGSGQIDSPMLTLPHPRMRERAFVLLPLAEIAPEWALAAQDPAITGQQIERIVPIERTDPGDRLVRTESCKP